MGSGAALTAALFAPPAAAQSCVVEVVAAAPAVAVGWLWLHDADTRSAGVLAAHARAAVVRQRWPGLLPTVHVDDTVAVLVVVSPAAVAPAAAELVAAVDDLGTLDDAAFARVRARVALQCDDEAHVLPGGALLRAARARLAGAAPALDAATVLATPRAAVVAFAAGRRPVRLAARGAVGDPLARALAAVSCAEAAPPRRDPRAGPAGAGRTAEVHPRVDQPFVAASFVVQGGAGAAAEVVAIEVARERAARSLRLRGSELRAAAPLVRFDALAGDDVVLFCRRGEDYRQLLRGEIVEADAAAEAAATAAELERLLATLRDTPVTAAEVSQSCTRWLAVHGLVPPTPASCDGVVLGGQLRSAMLARWRGLDAGALQAVDADAATVALRQLVAVDAAGWHTLLPAPMADRGWRRR